MASDEHRITNINDKITTLSRKLEEIESYIRWNSLVKENNQDQFDDTQADNERRRTPSLCDFVSHLFSQSSLHGLPNIATTSHNWIKIFWSLLLLAEILTRVMLNPEYPCFAGGKDKEQPLPGTGMAVWQTFQIFTEYFNYPVLTITEVHSGNVTLPQVTVCNTNGYLRTKLLQEPRIMDHLQNEDELGQIPGEYLAHLVGMLPQEDRIKLSHNISNFISWNDGRSSTLSYQILSRPMSGNCYTFTQTIRQQEKPGITLFINLNSEEYVKRFQRRQAIAFLQEEDVLPHSYAEPYIDLEPGHAVLVSLRMETIVRLNGKYQNCQDEEQKFFEETGMKYSEDVCKAVCLRKKVIANCGCISNVYNSFPSRFKISKLFEKVPDCMEYNETCYNRNNRLTNSDSCECKPRCNMKRYVLADIKIKKIKHFRWFCYKWDDCMMKENDTDKWVMNNVIYFDIKFSETEHKEYRQVPGYPLSQFLSDIGGTLGLYMGVSLLTLAEIPQLLIGMVIFFFKRKVLGIKMN